jgi:hypothetical protein
LSSTPWLGGANETDQGIMTYLKGYGKRIWIPIYLEMGENYDLKMPAGSKRWRTSSSRGPTWRWGRQHVLPPERRKVMKHLSKILPLVLVILFCGVPGLEAQPRYVPPPSVNLAPRWAPVPEAPNVYYAPNLGQDLFRFGNQFYYFSQGLWQIAQALTGPWQVIANPPQAFYNVPQQYFRTPPGWAKGRKTGWGGQSMPPGQMKKFGPGGFMPPGQMKKY